MQVTKETWRMHEQCVPGSFSSFPAQEPGNEARYAQFHSKNKLFNWLAMIFVNMNWRNRQIMCPLHDDQVVVWRGSSHDCLCLGQENLELMPWSGQ